jgi:hypothetical protein
MRFCRRRCCPHLRRTKPCLRIHVKPKRKDTDLALLENPVNFLPSTGSALELQTSLLQALAKSVRSLPSVIVRDFAGDVMENVGLGDTVGSMSTNPTHD